MSFTVTEKSFDANGRHIYGQLLLPEGKSGPMPTVIVAHGFGAVGGYKFSRICAGDYFAEAGFAVYVFDFCGGTEGCRSDWDMTQMSVMTEKQDLLAIIAMVRDLPTTDKKHLFLLGGSQGGLVSALTAEEAAGDLCALILYYPAFTIPESARSRFPTRADIPDTYFALNHTIGRRYYEDVYDLDAFAAVGKFDKPVLVLHGDADVLVDVSYGRRAAARYPKGEFVLLPGEIHAWTAEGKAKAAALAIDFAKKQL